MFCSRPQTQPRSASESRTEQRNTPLPAHIAAAIRDKSVEIIQIQVPMILVLDRTGQQQHFLSDPQHRNSPAGYTPGGNRNSPPQVQNQHAQYTLRPASWGSAPPLPQGRNPCTSNPQQVSHNHVGQPYEERGPTQERAINLVGRAEVPTYTHPRVPDQRMGHTSPFHLPNNRSPSVTSISSNEGGALPSRRPQLALPARQSAASTLSIFKKDLMSRVLDDNIREMPSGRRVTRALPVQSAASASFESRPLTSVVEPNKDMNKAGLGQGYLSISRIDTSVALGQHDQSSSSASSLSVTATPSAATTEQRVSSADSPILDSQMDQAEPDASTLPVPSTVDNTHQVQSHADEQTNGTATQGVSSMGIQQASNTQQNPEPERPIVAVVVKGADDRCPFPGCPDRLGYMKSGCDTHMRKYHYPVKTRKNCDKDMKFYELKDRVRCPWADCRSSIQLAQLGRHIASKHIRGIVFPCPYECGKLADQTRKETTARHVRDVHRQAPVAGWHGAAANGPAVTHDSEVDIESEDEDSEDDFVHRSDVANPVQQSPSLSAAESRPSAFTQDRSNHVQDVQMEPPIEAISNTEYGTMLYTMDASDDEDMIDVDELAGDDGMERYISFDSPSEGRRPMTITSATANFN